jgi:hypothetical protein
MGSKRRANTGLTRFSSQSAATHPRCVGWSLTDRRVTVLDEASRSHFSLPYGAEARKRARPQAEHRSRHTNRPRRVPPAASQHGRCACVERLPSLQQRRVRAGRGASLQGAWVCSISWPRAALRKLTRRTCLSVAASGREASCATGHEIEQTQGSRCESTDRLVDAPRPARTRLCRVPLHYRITVIPGSQDAHLLNLDASALDHRRHHAQLLLHEVLQLLH